jgi:Protein of unknown function (DUF2859)
MNKKLTSFLSLIGLVTLQQSAQANVAIPTAQQVVDSLQPSSNALVPLPKENLKTFMEDAYQVASPHLSVDPELALRCQSIHLKNIVSPIAVIGNDALSLAWLTAYAPFLKKQNTIIWLAQSSGMADVEKVKTLAPGLLVLPMSAEVLTHYFIFHYPILLSVK